MMNQYQNVRVAIKQPGGEVFAAFLSSFASDLTDVIQNSMKYVASKGNVKDTGYSARIVINSHKDDLTVVVDLQGTFNVFATLATRYPYGTWHDPEETLISEFLEGAVLQ
jgi:hypothetical protein